MTHLHRSKVLCKALPQVLVGGSGDVPVGNLTTYRKYHHHTNIPQRDAIQVSKKRAQQHEGEAVQSRTHTGVFCIRTVCGWGGCARIGEARPAKAACLYEVVDHDCLREWMCAVPERCNFVVRFLSLTKTMPVFLLHTICGSNVSCRALLRAQNRTYSCVTEMITFR